MNQKQYEKKLTLEIELQRKLINGFGMKCNRLEKENQKIKSLFYELWLQCIEQSPKGGPPYDCEGRKSFEEAARYLIEWGFITQDDLTYEV